MILFSDRCLNNLGWTISSSIYAIHDIIDNYCVKICYVLFKKKV